MRFVERGWWLVPVLLALIINGGILYNGFVWDAGHIAVSGEVKALGQEAPKIYFRPMVGMTFRLDQALWGGDAWGFHLTNLLLHAFNTLLVALIGIRIFEAWPSKKAAALFSASLFAVHPLHTEVVAWISGRNDLIPTLGLLMAVLAHLRYRSQTGPQNRSVPSRFRTFPFFLGGCLIALFGKESALPFLLIFPLYDVMVWKTERPGWRNLLTFSTSVVLVMAFGYLAVRARALGAPIGEMNSGGMSVMDKIQAGLFAAGFYLKKLIWPFPLNPFIIHPSGSFMVPTVGTYVYSAAGALGFGILGFFSIRRKFPMITLGLWAVFLGFAAALAVPLIPNIAVPYAERYLYLPSVGGIFLLTAAMMTGYQTIVRRARWRQSFGIGFAASVFLIGVSAGITMDQNRVWKSDRSLWEEAVKKSPLAALPRNRLGILYLDQGRLDEAAVHFKAALSGWGQEKVLATAATGLGVVYHNEGRYPESEEAFQKAFSHHDNDGIPHFYLAKMYWDWHQKGASHMTREESVVLLKKTRGELVKALIRTPGIVEAYYVLGLVNIELGRPDKASQSFSKVIELAPESSFAQDAARQLRGMR